MDPVYFGTYFSAVAHHPAGEELSSSVARHLGMAVDEYHKRNNKLPSKIIFYRDGVGEGQLKFVHDYEVTQMKKVLAEKYGSMEAVKLSVIIVTKRINTRIFNNGNNPAPGTVVDDVITNPNQFDFFIVSQSTNQGTVAPTSYNVLDNSSNLTPNEIHKLSYKLCHMYYNYFGTVRVPAPCQYAHKLAFLVSQSLKNLPHPNLRNTLYFL